MQNRRVWAEIDLDAISSNLRRVRFLAGEGKGIMAIVKANAYGHGAVPVAWHLSTQGISALGVGDSQEAIELRRAGISSPIVILGAVVHGELADVVANDIAVTVHSTERVRLLAREARRAGRWAAVHLKVDTGMGRLGCAPGRAVEIARLIEASEFLRFEGLCTHFSSASPGAEAVTATQIACFEEVAEALRHAALPVPSRHAAASAAILSRAGGHLDLVRPGISLYGVAPAPHLQAGLRPALALKTQVIFLKDFPAGTPIGYERGHITARRTRIATLPVGYNDGYPWRLGGKGEVLIRGRRAPVVGRVSMDYLMVDVGHIPGVSVGDEVVLIGAAGTETIGATELADRTGTIPYEILTRIGKRVVRAYHGGTDPLPERGFAIAHRPTEIPRPADKMTSPRSHRLGADG
ncbi:MAG: alanine racemase [Planctomycetota bacterium]|jgi:alanine racemase